MQLQNPEIFLFGGFADTDKYGGDHVEATIARVSHDGLGRMTMESSKYEPLALRRALGHDEGLVVLGGI